MLLLGIMMPTTAGDLTLTQLILHESKGSLLQGTGHMALIGGCDAGGKVSAVATIYWVFLGSGKSNMGFLWQP